MKRKVKTNIPNTWYSFLSLRFAQFVLGDSHLSGDEIGAYDSDISLLDDDDDADNSSDIMTDDLSLLIEQANAVLIWKNSGWKLTAIMPRVTCHRMMYALWVWCMHYGYDVCIMGMMYCIQFKVTFIDFL